MCTLACCGGGTHRPAGLCLCRWCVEYHAATGCCQCVAALARLLVPLDHFALCYGTESVQCLSAHQAPAQLLPQWQRLVPGQLLKTKDEEMDRIMSLSCARAPLEPSSQVDQYHRNLGWTRQVFSGTGGCDLILLG